MQVTFEVPAVGGRLVLVDMAGSENIEQAGIGMDARMQVLIPLLTFRLPSFVFPSSLRAAESSIQTSMLGSGSS